jgi:hypothetical protein
MSIYLMLDRRSDVSGSSSKSELIHIDITHKSSFFSRYITRRDMDMARGRGDRHWSYPLIHSRYILTEYVLFVDRILVNLALSPVYAKESRERISIRTTCLAITRVLDAWSTWRLLQSIWSMSVTCSWGIPSGSCEICSGSRRISRIRWSVAIVGDRCVSFLPRLIWTLQCRYIKIRHARKKPTRKVASSQGPWSVAALDVDIRWNWLPLIFSSTYGRSGGLLIGVLTPWIG